MDFTKNQKFIHKFIKLITKYFAQLLFIPVLFGGIIQVIRLYLISPQAVRFFSPAQAVSDGIFYLTIVIIYIIGILALIAISIPHFSLTLSNNLLRNEDKDVIEKESLEIEKKREFKLSHERMPVWAHILLLIIVLIGYYIIFFKTSGHFLENSRQIIAGAISFSFNFVLSIIFMRFIFSNEEYYFLENTKTFFLLNLSLCIICTFLYSIHSVNQNNFASNFKNLMIKHSCKNTGKVEIVYFNDKFVFLKRHCPPKEEEIIIEKIDSLFDSK